MSRRLRSTPWWEDCATLSHAPLVVEGACNPADPDGVFFARCGHCTRAAKRRRRLAEPRMTIVLDYLQPVYTYVSVLIPYDTWWWANQQFFKRTLVP